MRTFVLTYIGGSQKQVAADRWAADEYFVTFIDQAAKKTIFAAKKDSIFTIEEVVD